MVSVAKEKVLCKGMKIEYLHSLGLWGQKGEGEMQHHNYLMRGFLFLTFKLITLLSIGQAQAGILDVIYGEDNRFDFDDEASSDYGKYAKSVAAMIPSKSLNQATLGLDYVLDFKPLRLSIKQYTPEIPYGEQPATAVCTGFLVRDRVLATAGHCAKLRNSCENFRWVFDYRSDLLESERIPMVRAHNVYSCKKIIHQELSRKNNIDFALIELDRPVIGRPSFTLHDGEDLPESNTLMMLGHPLGVPLKVVTMGQVISDDLPNAFITDLDASRKFRFTSF